MLVNLVVWAALLAAAAPLGWQGATDLSGRPANPFGHSGARPVVLIFIRTDCPISNRYAPEISRLEREYRDRSDWYLVYADRAETPESVRRHIAAYAYSLQALLDPGQVLVRLAYATVTPEAAVFSPRGGLLYHGRIDDRVVSLGQSRPQASKDDLADALQQVLAGGAVKTPTTSAVGCSLTDVR